MRGYGHSIPAKIQKKILAGVQQLDSVISGSRSVIRLLLSVIWHIKLVWRTKNWKMENRSGSISACCSAKETKSRLSSQSKSMQLFVTRTRIHAGSNSLRFRQQVAPLKHPLFRAQHLGPQLTQPAPARSCRMTRVGPCQFIQLDSSLWEYSEERQ